MPSISRFSRAGSKPRNREMRDTAYNVISNARKVPTVTVASNQIDAEDVAPRRAVERWEAGMLPCRIVD